MAASFKWFQQGLGTRIDAFEVALKALVSGESEAASTIRQLAQSLLTPSSKFGFDSIYVAARGVADAADEALAKSAGELVQVLREEAAKAKAWSSVVLVIGGDETFNAELSRRLTTAHRTVIEAKTAAEAQSVLREKVVVFIVLNLLLPDLDGRTMLVRLKENPLTASIPALILADKLSQDTRDERLLSVDACFEMPVDVEEVAACVKSRLRRAHESMKEAHRDPLTSLLNRAAFREHLLKVLEACRVSQEPLAFAILSIDHARNLLNDYGLPMSDEIVQRVASLLSTSLRATDTVARWDVYEFAALFPGEDQFGGTRAIDKIRELLRTETFRSPDGRAVQVTLSAGVALAGLAMSVDSVVAEADRFMYQAQAAGGNRVVSDQTRGPKRTERVLLLLHDNVTARVVKHLFEKEGFSVTQLGDADEGVTAAAGRQRFHLIIVDEQIPKRGGFEVLQDLRRMPRNNRVPIVMLISRNSPQSVVQALELGANDYVITPLSPLTFMTHMRRLLTRGETARIPAGRYQTILIVDSELQCLMLAASALFERGGFRVLLSHGGHDAIHRFDEERPDAVVLPASLPGTPERDVLRVVSDAARNQQTRIILSASPEQRHIAQEHEKLVAGIINKPFNPRTFAMEVGRILGVPPTAQRPPQAIMQLNTEIQRVMRRGAAPNRPIE